jgi:hypothetical protein
MLLFTANFKNSNGIWQIIFNMAAAYEDAKLRPARHLVL